MTHDERLEIAEQCRRINEELLRLIRDMKRLTEMLEGKEAEKQDNAKALYLKKF